MKRLCSPFLAIWSQTRRNTRPAAYGTCYRTWENKKQLYSCFRCIEEDLDIYLEGYESVWGIKGKGNRPFDYLRNCRVFNERPFRKDVIDYCVTDMVYLPRLFEWYNENLGNKVALAATDDSAGKVVAESQRRAARAQDETFVLGIDAAPVAKLM